MADVSAHSSGRIRPQDADQVAIAALVTIACAVHDTTETEVALHLIGRVLPMTSAATRMQALKPHAAAVLDAAVNRRKRGEGAVAWARATLALRHAMSQDALRAALSRVEH